MVFCKSEFENQGFLHTVLFPIYEFVTVFRLFPVYQQKASPRLGEIPEGLPSISIVSSHFDNLPISKKGLEYLDLRKKYLLLS